MGNLINRMLYGNSNKPDLTEETIQNKSKIALFFEILGVKFFDLIKLNLLLLIFAIPFILWVISNFYAIFNTEIGEAQRMQYIFTFFLGSIPLLCILAVPLAGVTYIIRNFTQDRHAWLWSDFKTHSKSNFKQSLLYMFLFTVFMCLSQYISSIYSSMIEAGTIIFIMRGIFTGFNIFVCLSTIYVFPMIVTYDLKLKDIIRNSFILTIAKFPQTLLFAILAVLPGILLLLLSSVWAMGLVVFILYYAVFGIAFAMYTLISYTTPTFEKILTPSEESEEDTESSEQE